MISKFLARIFRRLWRIDAVKQAVFRRVYGHLYKPNGDSYMLRYAVISAGTWQSTVLKWLTGGKYTHARVHVITAPDADRELHNHPFNYRTFILRNWYMEEQPNYYRMLEEGDTAATKDSHFHRIAWVAPGGVTTLFVMGPDNGEWGFMVDGEFVVSKEFFKRRKIKADGTANTD